MNLYQRVIVLIKGLDQVVDEVRIKGFLADHDIPYADSGHRFVDAIVNSACEINRGVSLIGCEDFFGLFRCEWNDSNIVGRRQVHDGTGSGSHRPDPQFDIPVPERIGTLRERQACVFVRVQRDAKGFQHGLCHEIRTAPRASRADGFSLHLLNVGYGAFF